MSNAFVPPWLGAGEPLAARVGAVSTTREGGVSTGAYASLNLGGHVGDDTASVMANRQRLQTRVGAELLWLEQVHGTRVADAAEWHAGIEADALVVRERGRAAVVMTADCLPVLLASADGAVVAAAHAGWRGLAAGVLAETIAAMSVPPASLLAWIGPAISQAAFEVGDEVRDAFVGQQPGLAARFTANARGRWQADLTGLASDALRRAGVGRIDVAGRCTHGEDALFFSHRRSAPCGRMASAIWRR